MESILVLEAKGAERDRDKARKRWEGVVELLSASAATRLQDETACSLSLQCLCSSFCGARRDGRGCHLSYSISGGSTVCFIFACHANKELAPQTVRMSLASLYVHVLLCAVGWWRGGGERVPAQGGSGLPLFTASDEFI